MKKEINIIPTTVRIEKISLLHFLDDISEILQSVPELSEVRASGLSFSHPRGTISISAVSPDAFNISCPNPETMERLVEAIRKYYKSEIE